MIMAGECSTRLPTYASSSRSGRITPRHVDPTIAAPPVIVPTTIVRELLTPDNHDEWRSCIERYLKGQGLWEICTSSPPPSSIKRRRSCRIFPLGEEEQHGLTCSSDFLQPRDDISHQGYQLCRCSLENFVPNCQTNLLLFYRNK